MISATFKSFKISALAILMLIYLDIRNILNRHNEMPGLYYPTLGNFVPSYKNIGVQGGIPDPGISVLIRAGYKL